MMGPWKPRDTWMCVAVLLSLSLAYFIGRNTGRLDERLAANKTAIHASDSSTKSVQIRTDSAHKQSDSVARRYTDIRSKAKVIHDTVTVDSSRVYVDSTLAQLILSADSTIAAQARTIALQDTLISSLRVGLNLRDTRIKLLEREVTPGKFKRIITATKWIAVGAVIGVAYQHR